jgi:hypothetical protein
MSETKTVNPILVVLIGQAINMAARAATGGTLAIPDAVPLVQSLVDALGRVTLETDAERAQRRAETEAIFAKHSTPLVEVTP